MKIPSRECQCGCGEWFTPKRASNIYKNDKHCQRVQHRKQMKQVKSPFHYDKSQRKNNPIFGKSLFLPTEYRGLTK